MTQNDTEALIDILEQMRLERHESGAAVYPFY